MQEEKYLSQNSSIKITDLAKAIAPNSKQKLLE